MRVTVPIVLRPAGYPGDADQASGAIIPILVTPDPRPWYAWSDGVEASRLADLDKAVAVFDDHDLGRLFTDSLETHRERVRARLGPQLVPGDAIWLFGAGLVGRQTASLAAAHGLVVQGFLDNDPARRGDAEGLPVRAPEDVDLRRSVVAVCTGRGQGGIRAKLEGLGAGRVLGLSELTFLTDGRIEPESAYLDDLWTSRFRYLGLAASLQDDLSRRVLAAVLRHRLTLQLEALQEVCAGDQWFIPEVFRQDSRAVFVDGGAYDGDTAVDFLRRNGGPGEALELFEPSRRHAERAARRLEAFRQARVHRAGLGAQSGAATFASTEGMDGAFASSGDEEVDIVALDDVLGARASFIKLDVEGYEEAALSGAEQTIRASTPVLAVAAYHRAADLWRVPAWIAALGLGYRLFIRHHTELRYETVVYAAV
jgi:FkbM family methyltransferase